MDYPALPDRLRKVVTQLSEELSTDPRVVQMRERWMDLPHQSVPERVLAAELMSIAMVPEARARLEAAMDDHWDEDRIKNRGMSSRLKPEIVIGTGYHAAVWCAVRARMGKPKPLCIDMADRAGGRSFACSKTATFFTNSRNRKGEANQPGEQEGLNVIPGALIQPSMISGDEYQSNADIAFCIRLTLAMTANVALGREVQRVDRWYGEYDYDSNMRYGRTMGPAVELSDGRRRSKRLRAERVINAGGLGSERRLGFESQNVKTFTEFMQWMDQPFPLRGLNRVAVIGGGDSGKCAVEALFGMGPAQHWSVPELDQVKACDWYTDLERVCEPFRNSVRTRYKRISALLPAQSTSRERSRLRMINETDRMSYSPIYNGIEINGRRYDLAIFCTGYDQNQRLLTGSEAIVLGDRAVGTKSSIEYYAVGPRANLAFSAYEEQYKQYANVGDNRVAMWRLGPRTAALAQSLS